MANPRHDDHDPFCSWNWEPDEAWVYSDWPPCQCERIGRVRKDEQELARGRVMAEAALVRAEYAKPTHRLRLRIVQRLVAAAGNGP